MNYFFIFIKKIIFISLFLGFFSFSVVLFFLWKYTPDLPSYAELKNYNPNLSSRIFTSDGFLLDMQHGSSLFLTRIKIYNRTMRDSHHEYQMA